MGTRILYILIGAVIAIAIMTTALYVACNSILPSYFKTQVEESLAEACPKCELSIGDLALEYGSSTVRLSEVSFASDPADSTAEKVKLGEVTARLNLKDLIEHQIKIEDLVMTDLIVTIIERHTPDLTPEEKKNKKYEPVSYGGRFLEGLPVLRIERIELKNAKLEYILKIFGKQAQFNVSDINAKITALGTRKSVAPRFTSAALTAKVQGSGALNFHCRADLFSMKNEDQIEIELRHLKMPDLNSFFSKEDGIHFEGELDRALATIALDQGMLTGSLAADYRDLTIHFDATPDTGEFKTFLTNLFSGLKIQKTKNTNSKPPAMAPVNYKREPGQGLIKFILAGLKEAAMSVVSK